MKRLFYTILLLIIPMLSFYGQVRVVYSFEKGIATDDGNSYAGSLVNNAEIVTLKDGNHALSTGAENGYLDLGAALGNAVLPHLDSDFSVSIDLYSSADNNLQSDGNFLWTFSSQAPSSNPSNYMMMRIKNSATGYTMRFGTTNYRLGESQSVPTGKWLNLTYVHQGDSAFLYMDGERIEAKDYSSSWGWGPQQNSYVTPASLYMNAGSMDYNYIGKSPWSSNAYVKNALVDNFVIVDTAMDAAKIKAHNSALAAYSHEVDYGVSSRNHLTLLNAAVTLAERLQAAGVNQAFSAGNTDLLADAKSMIAAGTASKQEADSVAALLTTVASAYISGNVAGKASETNTYPLTGLIINPSFTTSLSVRDSVKGWDGTVARNDSSIDGSYWDTYLIYNTRKLDVCQQIQNLPNGLYRMEASTRMPYMLEKYMYATSAKGKLRQRMMVSGKSWQQIENSDSLNTVLDSIVVTDGKLCIGVCGENSKNDAMVDNVTLLYIGNGTTSSAYLQTTDTGITIPTKVTAADLPAVEDVKAMIEKANDYWQTNKSYNVSSSWDNAVYQTGNMEAYFYTGNQDYRDFAMKWAGRNNWCGSTGDEPTQWKYTYGDGANYALFGDWQCCFQTYIDLYNSDSLKPDSMVARAKFVMDYMVKQDTTAYWWWADALYMAMPVMTKMFKLTGDTAYLDKMYLCFNDARNLMYDEENHLFFRDANYIYPKHTTTRGLRDYWSRGDGWVAAGLAKILNDMPADYTHYDYFKSIYKDIINALVKNQKSQGYWTESLADTLFATCYESSGTCLDTYALLWGVNHKVLDECTYCPYIRRAWNYLTTIALQEDGSVGYMQPIGAAASENAQLYPSNVTNFGTGAFLLAACEMGRYAESKQTVGVQSPVTEKASNTNRRGIFNVNGQRLTKLQRGINIINGKKVLMK